MLPLLLNAVHGLRLNLEDVARLTAYNPARLFGVAKKGYIAAGYDADLVVVDMESERIVDKEKLYSKCHWSPFEGWKLKGWPVMTFVGGEVVMREGEIVGEVYGREIKF